MLTNITEVYVVVAVTEAYVVVAVVVVIVVVAAVVAVVVGSYNRRKRQISMQKRRDVFSVLA